MVEYETLIKAKEIYEGKFEGTKEWQLYQTRLIRNGFLELTNIYYPIIP